MIKRMPKRPPPNSIARFACPRTGEAMGANWNSADRVLVAWPEDEGAPEAAHRFADGLEGRWSGLPAVVAALEQEGVPNVKFVPNPRPSDTLAGLLASFFRGCPTLR